MMKHSPYLSAVLMDRQHHTDCVQAILRCLTRRDDEFDAIACTGVSGMLIAPTIAYLMGKRLAVVRKEQDVVGKANHACVKVEHNLLDGDRVVVIDDLIASGRTMAAICQAIHDLRYKFEHEGLTSAILKCEVVGYYLYRDHKYTTGSW